jgi:hypothetical protein
MEEENSLDTTGGGPNDKEPYAADITKILASKNLDRPLKELMNENTELKGEIVRLQDRL